MTTGRLFEEHGRMAFALCNVLLRDRHEAEDATQQCFLSVHRSLLAGTEADDAASWIATIARNECLTRLRRRHAPTVELLEDDHPSGGDLADVATQRAEIEALSRAIAGLPPAQRQAVLLRDFYGLSYHEIALALGVSGSAVESLLFKSRKRLQERLRPLRAASGVAAAPAGVRDALAAVIPGFSGNTTVAAGAAAKLLSAPLAAKIAAGIAAAGVATFSITAAIPGGHARPSAAVPAPIAGAGADIAPEDLSAIHAAEHPAAPARSHKPKPRALPHLHHPAPARQASTPPAPTSPAPAPAANPQPPSTSSSAVAPPALPPVHATPMPKAAPAPAAAAPRHASDRGDDSAHGGAAAVARDGEGGGDRAGDGDGGTRTTGSASIGPRTTVAPTATTATIPSTPAAPVTSEVSGAGGGSGDGSSDGGAPAATTTTVDGSSSGPDSSGSDGGDGSRSGGDGHLSGGD